MAEKNEGLNNFIAMTGLTQSRAILFWDRAGNNIDKALQLYKSEAKNIAVVFGTFSGNTSKYCGAFFFSFNIEKKEIIRETAILSYSKNLVFDFDIDDWDIFEKKVYDKKIEGKDVIENMSNETDAFFEKMMNRDNYKSIIYDSLQSNNTSHIRAILNDLASKAIGDMGVDLNFHTELLSEVEFSHEDENPILSDTAEEPEVSAADVGALWEQESRDKIIKIDFIISPVGGKAVRGLKVGDVIYTKVLRLIELPTEFLKDFATTLSSDFGIIPSKISELKYNAQSERFEILVKFTDNIYGKGIIGANVKLKTGEAATANTVTDGIKDNFSKISIYLVIGGIIIIIMIIAVVLYLIFGLL